MLLLLSDAGADDAEEEEKIPVMLVEAEDGAADVEEALAKVETSLPFSMKRPLRLLQQSAPGSVYLLPQQRLPSPHVVSGSTCAAAFWLELSLSACGIAKMSVLP